jgi:hypothetical protein
MFEGVGGTGTITREGGGWGDNNGDGDDDAVVDAEKEDGDAYGGDSGDVCDWTSGDDTVGEDRFDVDLIGHVELLLSLLIVDPPSLVTARRPLPLAIGCAAGGDLTTSAVVDPEGDDARTLEESVPEPPTVLLPEADKAFDVDDGIGDIVSVRIEDSLDDGELVEVPLACCDVSEDVREGLGRGSFGNGPAGGGELEPDPT